MDQLAPTLVRRREPKRFAPTSHAKPVTKNGDAWHVRTIPPIVPNPGLRSGHSEPKADVRRSAPVSLPPLPEPNWMATQAYVESRQVGEMPAQVFAAQPPAIPEESGPLIPAITASGDWAPMKPAQMPKLTPWPGLDAQMKIETPPHRRGRGWRMIIVSSCVMIAGGVTALIIAIDQQRSEQVRTLTLAMEKATAAAAPSETVLPGVPAEPAIAWPKESELGLKETESLAKPMLEELMAAKTSAKSAWVAFPRAQQDSLDAFFAKRPEPMRLKSLRAVPINVTAMPGKFPITLCEVRCEPDTGASAITRLLTSDDGSLKLDWPLLRDSMDEALTKYVKAGKSEPRWIVVGLKRSFGFTLPGHVRNTHYVFDIQCSGNGKDLAQAVLTKDSPTGRAFEQMLDWNQLYLMRVLFHWTEIEGEPMLTVLDGELSSSK